jgi:hypothetical protein
MGGELAMQAVVHLDCAVFLGVPYGRVKQLVTVLSWFLNQDHEATVSVPRLAKAMGCCVRTVQRAIQDAQNLGILKVVPRQGPKGERLCNRFILLVEEIKKRASCVRRFFRWPKRLWYPKREPSPRTGNPPGDKMPPKPITTQNLITALTTIFTQKRGRTFGKRPHLSEHAQRNILACREYLFGRQQR